MKKTIFLFLLAIIFVSSSTNSSVLGAEEIYEIDNYEVIVTKFKEDGITGFTVEKTGVNPFVSTIIDDSENYIITGVKSIGDYYILYGYGFDKSRYTQYDSLFFVFDTAGNTIFKELRDYGSMEIIKDIFYVDDIFITYTEKVDDVDYNYVFVSNYFSNYDLDFNYIDSVEIGDLIIIVNTNEMYVLIGYGFDEYDVAIRSDLTLITKRDTIEISEGQVFIDTVTIEFVNEATLNNQFIENGVIISYPGNYTLNYNNKIYNFTVDPIISGVVNNQIYNESVTPTFSSGNAILNNDIYVSNTEISIPGNYSFIVTGANNYTKEIDFTITSNLSGIVNNSSYLEPVTLEFDGDGYLNNQFIESPYEVSMNGDYILKIRGENSYLETYFFSVEEDVKESSFIDFVQRVDILVLVVVLISGGIILKKK